MVHKRKRSSSKQKKKSQHQDIPFVIETMDGLGQGVSKVNNKVTFIAKTLPGEQGVAIVHKRSKGVIFAQLKQLETSASDRRESLCPHFDDCPACHYLHTEYKQELGFKKQSLSDISRHLALPEKGIDIFSAPSRLHYRNRIQLHYRHQYIGMVNALTDDIVEIPECKIIRPELQAAFDSLYSDKNWCNTHSGRGHVELYWRPEEGVTIQWNEAYAFGGFSQVYDAMNQMLCSHVYDYLNLINADSVLDLFSGEGNLTNDYISVKQKIRKMIDFSPENQASDFSCLDLFSDNALSQFQRLHKKAVFDTLVVDPPRKGFPLLVKWIKHYKPKHLIYVSCNAATQVRDLQSLDKDNIDYTIETMSLLDLFPSTYHYESIAYIKFKQ